MNVSAEALGAGLSGLGSFGGENEPPPSAPTQANPGLRWPSLVAKGTGSLGPGCYIPSLPNSLPVLLPLSLVTRGRRLLKSFLGWELPLSQLGASLLRKPPPSLLPPGSTGCQATLVSLSGPWEASAVPSFPSAGICNFVVKMATGWLIT